MGNACAVVVVLCMLLMPMCKENIDYVRRCTLTMGGPYWERAGGDYSTWVTNPDA